MRDNPRIWDTNALFIIYIEEMLGWLKNVGFTAERKGQHMCPHLNTTNHSHLQSVQFSVTEMSTPKHSMGSPQNHATDKSKKEKTISIRPYAKIQKNNGLHK